MGQIRVGLVGAGAMGANHARVVAASADAELATIVDPDRDRAQRIAALTGASAATDIAALADCDAVIVACPTEHHTPVALDLIESGTPILVEKPLAASYDDATAIVDAAERRDVPLLCGFVERFNAAVSTAAGILEEPPVHVVSIRHSPPTPRITTSVVYDLLIHDVDLTIGFLADQQVMSVAATGSDGSTPGITDVADCLLRFDNGTVASLSASRVSQRKIRSLLLTTPTALVEVDLLRQDVTVYRNTTHEHLGDTSTYRAQTVIDIPFVRHTGEPLALQFDHFVRLVQGDVDPVAERATLLAPHRVAAEVASSTDAALVAEGSR